MKDLKEATEQEWIELQYLTTLGSRDGGKVVLDLIQKIYNTFVNDKTKICRSCPSQIASIMGIIKLRFDLNKEFLSNKFKKESEPLCRLCGKEFIRDKKTIKYCGVCRTRKD